MPIQVTNLCPLLQVFDMPVAIRFYSDALAFTVVHTSGEVDAPEGRHFQWAYLQNGPATLMLNTAYDVGERPTAIDEQRNEIHADTEIYLSCNDVDATYRELKSTGLSLTEPEDTPYGMRQLRLRDPDGYSICFQQAI